MSLVIPGVVGMFKPGIGRTWLVAENVDAKNHLRALNAMMAALGAVALYACWDLERSRLLVLALGVGACATDPVERTVMIFMTQITSYRHFNIRYDFPNLVKRLMILETWRPLSPRCSLRYRFLTP